MSRTFIINRIDKPSLLNYNTIRSNWERWHETQKIIEGQLLQIAFAGTFILMFSQFSFTLQAKQFLFSAVLITLNHQLWVAFFWRLIFMRL